MKLRFDKKARSVVGIVLVFVVAAAAGLISSQIINKPMVEEQRPASGLPKEVDAVQALRNEGKADEANKKADETLAQTGAPDETKYLLYIQKGLTAVDANDFKAAVESYTLAAKVKETSEIYTMIGQVNFMLGDKAAAKAAYEKAITLIDPESPLAEVDKKKLEQRIAIIDGKETPR